MMIKCTFAPVSTSKLVQCSVLFCNLDPKLFLYSVLCSAEQNTTVLEHVCCVLSFLKLDLKNSSTRDHKKRNPVDRKFICLHMPSYLRLKNGSKIVPPY